MPKIKIFIISLAIMLQFSVVHSIQWLVPYPIPSIQEAIAEHAENGDTISVLQGDVNNPAVYPENINFLGKNILVVNRDFLGGGNNPATCIIDGQQKSSVVIFNSGETRDAILKGFTIRNGSGTNYNNYDYGGGIFCLNSSPTITKNHITTNFVPGNNGHGGGIEVFGKFSQPRITNNIIDTNYAFPCGAGIAFDSLADPVIDSNYIYNNGYVDEYTTWRGGGIAVCNENIPASTLGTIYNNKFTGNIADHDFVIYFYNSTSIVQANEFVGNPCQFNVPAINCDYTDSSAVPKFGTQQNLGLNVFKDNGGSEDLVCSGYPPTILQAKGNYWNTIDTDTIISRLDPVTVAFDPIAASDRVANVSYNSACSTDVIVTGDLTVNSNVTLNIASGKTFKFTTTADTNTGDYSGCELLVNGKLHAIGTASNKIKLTSNATSPQTNDWYGIRLQSNSVGKFNNCQVKYGYCGIEAISNDTLYVDSSLIQSNQAYGINIIEAEYAEIKESEFNGGVYGIRATSTSPIIANNKFESNTSYGIFLEQTEEAMILKNYLNGLSDAPTLYGIGLAEAGQNVYVDGNRIEKWNQAGIYINQESRAQANKDTIIDNTLCGILCCNSSSPKVRWCEMENNETGVYCENTFPDLGTEEDRGNNSIDTNNYYYIVNTSETNDSISAKDNWWGTDEPDPEKFLGLVAYHPLLPHPPESGGQSAGIVNTAYPFMLYAPKPNPTSRAVKIAYSLPCKCQAELIIYNASGRIITKTVEGKEAGRYEYLWNNHKFPNGIYIIRLKADNKFASQKVITAK